MSKLKLILTLAIFVPLSVHAQRDNCPSGDCSSSSGPLGDIFAMVFWAFVGIAILWAIINKDTKAIKFYGLILAAVYLPIVGFVGVFFLISGNYDYGVPALIAAYAGYKLMLK
jgi:disulfide bond formation protein DsbB